MYSRRFGPFRPEGTPCESVRPVHSISFRSARRRARAVAAALVVAGTLLGNIPAWAQSSAGTRSIFSVGAGARSLALARAFVGLADDATAAYWNSSGLARLERAEVVANHISLYSSFSEASAFYVGIAYPTMSMGTFGLAFMRLGSNFDAYDASSRYLGRSGYDESQTLLSYAFSKRLPYLGGATSFGISAKIVHQSIDPFSSTGTGLDLGFLYTPDKVPALSLGLNLQDIAGANLKLSNVEESTPHTMMLGASYGVTVGRAGRLNLLFGYDSPQFDRRMLHLGAEYVHAGRVAARIGWDDGTMTFGIGVGFKSYRIDYGYVGTEAAGSSHPVAFTAGLGPTQEEKLLARRELRRMELEDEVNSMFREKIEERAREARAFESNREYAEALDSWKIVLEFDPDDEEARQGVETAQREIRLLQEAEVQEGTSRALVSMEFRRGLEYYTASDYNLARARFREVLELDPGNEEAEAYLEKIEVKMREQMEYHRQRAQSLQASGDKAGALMEWSRVRYFDPEDREAKTAVDSLKVELDRMETDIRDLKTGNEDLRAVLEASRIELEANRLYNEALNDYSAGALDSARSKLEDLLELDPSNIEASALKRRIDLKTRPLSADDKERIRELYLTGMKFFTKDEFSKAIETWEKILEIDPDNESIQRNIEEARLRLDGGKP